MSYKYLLYLWFLVTFSWACSREHIPSLKEGDIVFQTSHSKQSEAIQLATHSTYSHVGLVLNVKGTLEVFEAIGPVKYTSIDEWVACGKKQSLAVRRLKDSISLNQNALVGMEQAAERLIGKPYDWGFDWPDDKMYCSEAVWKVFQRGTGIMLCQPAPLRSFEISSPKIQTVLKERYGNNIPYDEPMVSPQQIYDSPLLYSVN